MKPLVAILAAAALACVIGCEAQTRTVTVADPAVTEQNTKLQEQVATLECQKSGLQKELIAREGDISAERENARLWKEKYEAAKDAMPAGGETVPPELMKAFLLLARAGGPWEVGEGGTLKAGSDVLFDSGKTDVKPAGQNALKEIAPKLKQILADKRVMLAVEGHTDNVPIKYSSFKDNRHLSLMRAHAVVTTLVQQGLSPVSLRAVGMGEFQPVASNDTKEGRALNRRVELRLINANSPEATSPVAAPDAAPPDLAPAPPPEPEIGS